MKTSKFAYAAISGFLAVGLGATGFVAQGAAPAIDIDDLLNQLADYEKGAEGILNTDPDSINWQQEIDKLTGYEVKGLNKFLKSEAHTGLLLHTNLKKKSRVKVVDRENGQVVQRGKVAAKPKLFEIGQGKFRVTATRGAKTATQKFKITNRYGANVYLDMKKK